MSISRRFITDSTVSTYPARSIAVNSSIDANLGVITFTLVSNLTPGLVLNYSLPNTDSTDFVEGNSGTLTVNGSGGATITRTLSRYVNYSNVNVTSQLAITSPAGTALVNSANFVIAPAVPFAATGGTTTTVNGNVVHTFSANSNLVVTNTGEVGSEIVRSLIVAGGGAGNRATSFNEIFFGAYNQWNRQTSGGGGGGGVLEPNLTLNSFSVTSYPVFVGLGGRQPISGENDLARKGSNSSIFGYTSLGGGGSSSATIGAMNGGSGGGGSTNTSFGVGTVGQGTNGGTGNTYVSSASRVSNYSGGGGGKSTAGGSAAGGSTSAAGGNGGAGLTSNITGANVVYGSGGGGGGYTAGLGGTGAGNGGYFTNLTGTGAPGQNGTDGVGGGGGGAGQSGANGTNTYDGGNGGRGTVIVTYRTQYRVLKPA